MHIATLASFAILVIMVFVSLVIVQAMWRCCCVVHSAAIPTAQSIPLLAISSRCNVICRVAPIDRQSTIYLDLLTLPTLQFWILVRPYTFFKVIFKDFQGIQFAQYLFTTCPNLIKAQNLIKASLLRPDRSLLLFLFL